MKKILVGSLVLCLGMALSANEDLKEKMKQIGLFKSDGIKIVDVIDNKSIYHVGGKNKLKNGKEMPFDAFVTKDLKYVILGKGFTGTNGEELFIPKDISHIKDVAAFTIGTGKEDLYLFTDPECPYCIELEKNLNSQLTKEKLNKIKIHVVLFPLPFHKNAKSMSYYILSKKTNNDRYKAFKEVVLEKSDAYKKYAHTMSDIEKYNKYLSAQELIVNEQGVQGTPTLLNSNGKKINPAQLFR